MNDRLNQLALFVRTVETGSFSKAAREFGRSQPSVSRAVASLEARLGVTLLRRTTRRISATDVGLALAESARNALAAIDDAENVARGTDRLTGVLRVSLPTAFGVRMIVPLLPGFLLLQPGLRVELMMSDRFDNLVAEGVDLALRLGNQPDSAFLTRKLTSAARVIVASPSYLQQSGVPKTIAELRHHDCLGGPGDTERTNWTFTRAGKQEIVSTAVRVRTASGAGLVACAVAGLGIAVPSEWMCAEELRDGRLTRILDEYVPEPINAFVVYGSGQRPSRKARAFAEYLLAEFAEKDVVGESGGNRRANSNTQHRRPK
jgi:DNA-binding transcriptional LysR family regulator